MCSRITYNEFSYYTECVMQQVGGHVCVCLCIRLCLSFACVCVCPFSTETARFLHIRTYKD
jgi:hypothetical protein